MTRSQHARFIPGEEVGTVTEWDFGAVDQASVRFAAKLKAQASLEEQAKEENFRKAGFTDGYSQGYTQGHAQATLEGQRQITEYIATQGQETARTFGQLFETVRAQLAESEQVMAKGVLELACEVARQVLRHEMSTNPNALQPVVREALSVLAIDSKAALVRLNPLDMEVLAEVLRQEFSSLSLTLLPDASITRGGCLVESAGTVVDGTVEKRWKRAVASLGLENAWEDDHDAA
ncbi:flagellar assembly protein FliH [Rhodoferax saidenbachensis]|uniref:Flagellar assembly protein FliH n=1 Tax=Rhodoferax saidenbachensis TaxID=1484693 RepID=A0ABU1ZTN0_9BURK|nr:flagellar assembly protein FliH [Rhodoferax saidenbachensis]MDR7308895.1 flagellar assembly protein FliH [Rhodoferax saidenbachensis]